MNQAFRSLLLASALAFPAGTALADGPGSDYGAAGPYDGQPSYLNDQSGQNGQYQQNGQYPQNGDGSVYQAPPDGVCYDDNNQAYDCSGDQTAASAADPESAVTNDLDDGYDQTAYTDFQEALSPYGNWVDTPDYGRIWTPSSAAVGYDFSPYYSGGRWALTDYGWTWASDYNWGWAPFHYGRWISHSGYGWCWVPGRIWGPAWVSWRHGGGYAGWTPLPPRGVRIAPPVGARVARWNFVPTGQLGAPRMTRVSPAVVPQVFARTAASNTFRTVGTTQVNIGPLPHTMQLSVRPTPLHTLTGSLPRAQVTVRPGMALQSRPYAASVGARPFQGQGGAYQRQAPGFQPGAQRPGFQQPTYQRPAYQQPGYQRQAPGFQQPYQHPAPGYRPMYQPRTLSPTYQRPTYQAPTYQRPAYQAPAYSRPSYQAPAYSRPSYQAPVYSAPSHSYSAPVYSAPSHSYSAPSHSAPSFSAPSHSSGGGGGHVSAPSGGGGGGHHR